jgi:hypothetical protein
MAAEVHNSAAALEVRNSSAAKMRHAAAEVTAAASAAPMELRLPGLWREEK